MAENKIDIRQLPLRDPEIPRAPAFPIYRVRNGKNVRILVRVVPLEEPEEGKDPFIPYDNQTQQVLELKPSERVQGYLKLKHGPPDTLLEEAKKEKRTPSTRVQENPQEQSLRTTS